MYETYLMELGYKGKTGAMTLVKPGAKGGLREDGNSVLWLTYVIPTFDVNNRALNIFFDE